MMNSCFKLTVRCFTYNHYSYVQDTMNGFCKQQTGFPYICLIVDDASNDDAQTIIKNYFETNFERVDSNHQLETEDYYFCYGVHKTNRNCFFAVFLLKYNHYRKKKDKKKYLREWLDNTQYHAFCEGDDYWTDPFKLQKQVDYLDAHPECGFVYSDFTCVNTKNEVDEEAQKRYDKCRQLSKSGYLFDYCFLNDGFILTCTICYRSSLFDEQQASSIDTSLFMTLARQSSAYYMPEVTACYRINPESWMHTRLKFIMDITFQIKYDQFYYAYRYKDTTAKYYFTSPESKRNFPIMYTYCVLYIMKGKVKGLKKLLYVTLKSPRLLILLPFNLFKVITHKN